MSVLVRRDQDSREAFSRKWERHAEPVSRLPRLRGYIQNHVVEDYALRDGAAPLRADGFVELLWDRPEDMQAAFQSDAARPMVEDEPGFLGHGSGYAMAQAPPLMDAAPSAKLLLTLVYPANLAEVEQLAAAICGRLGGALIVDRVVSLIPKPGMAPPQPAHAFLHLYLGDAATAQSAAAELTAGLRSAHETSAALHRVRTIRFA